MRLKALRELGKTEAPCLVATEDDAYTYNDKVSRIAPIQEHRMILRAVEQGVTPEQIARSLDVEVEKIRRGLNLLDGIHPDAVDMLKDKPITEAALRIFKKVKEVRQLDFAHLMVSMGNYTAGYARALLIATPPEMLVKPHAPKAVRGLKAEDLSQMEKGNGVTGAGFSSLPGQLRRKHPVPQCGPALRETLGREPAGETLPHQTLSGDSGGT
jgi:hypothetical protein